MSKSRRKSKRLSVYANLAEKHRSKKDARARKKARYLATLPKHPVKRFFYRLHPKRFFAFWFSREGVLMSMKIFGVIGLIGILSVGSLFAYYRKDLDKIRPGEISKRVQTTVTKYYDRNDNLLWEDKGTGDYRLVVESDQLSDYLKKATVAIEDKDYYKHHGISISGLTRAFITNMSGDKVQGGSTLTQQLVKLVFFADDAGKRGLDGIPRKIKETILAVEVERMYNKDQILALYLNESPYGGRRNGAESAAQTYFNKSAKDLTLAEAALLAAIPQNPSVFNPYNPEGHEALINRQHTVLSYMADQKYITKEEAEEAKQYPILDNIRPLKDQLSDIKAPHFVLMVRDDLEKELGKAVVGRGGLKVKTTLDLRIQEKLEQEVTSFFDSGAPASLNISNTAASIEDTETGQVVALLGSRDFWYPGFGQDNAAVAYIQPASTIKPLVYAELFQNKGDDSQNYGSGSILSDDNIDKIYGAKLRNWDGRFMGSMPIGRALALSRNIPAVKAMYISGVEPTIQTIRDMGNTNYCKPEQDAAGGGLFLSSAIGACGSKTTELVNAYGTLARMGVAKPTTSVLEVKNYQGETLKKWKDKGKQVIDPEVAYIVSDMLSDQRIGLHGYGLAVPGVRTAAKTGTSDKNTLPKDLWVVNYSPVLSMGIWLGNSDTSVVSAPASSFAMPVVKAVMQYAHEEVYAKDNKWSPGMWFEKPPGVQSVGGWLYPSWWNKKQGQTNAKLTFDKVSKKKATDCTPEAARIELDVFKSIDPITKKEVFSSPDGYDATKDDDVHTCNNADEPSLGSISAKAPESGSTYTVEVNVINGKYNLSTIEFLLNGHVVKTASLPAASSKQSTQITLPGPGSYEVSVRIQDEAYYTAASSTTINFKGSD